MMSGKTASGYRTNVVVLKEPEAEERVANIDTWRVQVETGGLKQTYWMEKVAPHIVVKMVSSDGREMILKSRSRRAYWNR